MQNGSRVFQCQSAEPRQDVLLEGPGLPESKDAGCLGGMGVYE